MNLDISTPALLFPAISLLLLAYTNRYLTLASVIRSLSAGIKERDPKNTRSQIENLAMRIDLIRYMQMAGIISLILCVASMGCIWGELATLGGIAFALSLVCMALSLLIAYREVTLSGKALSLELEDMEARSQEVG